LELTKTEKNILKAVGECGSTSLTAHGIAEKAGCSPAFVCEKLKDPDFKTLFREVMEASLSAEVPEILKTFTEAAKQGSFKHGKLILELTGVYSEKQRVEMSGKVDLGDSPFKNEEERNEFIQTTLSKVRSGLEEK